MQEFRCKTFVALCEVIIWSRKLQEETYCEARPFPRCPILLVLNLWHNSPVTGDVRRLFKPFLHRWQLGDVRRVLERTRLPAGHVLPRLNCSLVLSWLSSSRAHVVNERRPCARVGVKSGLPRNGIERPRRRVDDSRLQQEACTRIREDTRRLLHAVARSLTRRFANKQASSTSPHCIQTRSNLLSCKSCTKRVTLVTPTN